MFSQDSRDKHVSLAYRSLFYDMHKHPILEKTPIVEKMIEERLNFEAENDKTSENIPFSEPVPVPAPRVEYTKLYLYVYKTGTNFPEKKSEKKEISFI